MPFYWELATLVTIMLLGHWMEMRAVGSAQSALRGWRTLPDTAERIVDGADRRRARRALSRSATWCWYGRERRFRRR